VNATLKTYVLAAHSRINTRSDPFSRCIWNNEGKAYNMYPTYPRRPKAQILVKLKLHKESARSKTCNNHRSLFIYLMGNGYVLGIPE
jgi:hypothetical protein